MCCDVSSDAQTSQSSLCYLQSAPEHRLLRIIMPSGSCQMVYMATNKVTLPSSSHFKTARGHSFTTIEWFVVVADCCVCNQRNNT